MLKHVPCFAFALFASLSVVSLQPARAQDTNGPSPLSFLDTTGSPYDILVDSSLAADNPAAMQFRTLQAAYAAASAGTPTRQTVIGIKPDVYQITGTATTPGLTISKNYITLLGLTNDHRNVVLADNRGNQEGAGSPTASYNGYVIIVSATGFQARNLTILNYCNNDYEYPGNSAKNLTMRSPVITQAVALQASGDKHIYDHVALLSRLDTTFILTTRAYFNNVYIEGTDDFIGGGTISVWQDSVVNFPTGSGVPSVSGTVFINTKFINNGGTNQFYKGFPSGSTLPAVLINCTMPVNTGQSVAWVRGFAPVRNNLYSLTYHIKDSNGNATQVADASQGPITYNLSRELSDTEVQAFNPWNLLRATPTGAADDWDPAGAATTYAAQGNLPFGMAITNGNPSIITNQTTATISATVTPARAPNTITWSTNSNLISLNQGTGASVIVSGANNTGVSQYAPITVSAPNGFYITAWVFVQPPFIAPPTFVSPPTLTAPFNGTVTLKYTLNAAAGQIDQSIITWSSCDNASGSNPRTVGISNGNVPLQTYSLQLGDVGRYLQATIQPKLDISNPGTAVPVIAGTPIAISNIVSTTVSPNFMNFPVTANSNYVSGYWTVLGTFTSQAQPTGSTYVNAWGVRVGSQGASLLYQQDAAYGDMRADIVMSPEKTAGQGFGSPGSGADSNPPTFVQNADIYIKYDPRTQNGYSLRWWRTTSSATDCMFQLYQPSTVSVRR
jgi:pectin methylesterase-like acyl-CoA thioesterase